MISVRKVNVYSFIVEADTGEKTEKTASGIFQMIKKDPSSIVRNENPVKPIRKDYRGTLIAKGQKGHKVVYLDQVTKAELVEVVMIESFKEYNIDMSNPNENCSCKCILI